MSYERNSAGRRFWQAFVLILLVFSYRSFSQDQRDTILKIEKGSYLNLKGIHSFVSRDTVITIPASLKLTSASRHSKTVAFYDSLKTRAYKSKIARAVYDLVVVTPGSSSPGRMPEKSEDDFSEYSGLRIRKIDIIRLSAFGTRLDNPGFYEPKPMEKLLNSTHVNTNERIIRNYLLFNEGDTITSLTLTDNERIIRQLPYIHDARILVIPVSQSEADIMVVTKDSYSLGGELTLRGAGKGSLWLFEKNLVGLGHELKFEVPWSSESPDSPGIGAYYNINNIRRSFLNLNLQYYNALDIETYGISLVRKLISSETRYAGGAVLKYMHTFEDLDTLPEPEPIEYTFQDYWIQRSFLLSRENVSRLILGARYVNNNVFEKPAIRSDTYYYLQKYRLYLGSVAFSAQEYYKTSMIYSYGRAEDIPNGSLLRITAGMEQNEFKKRAYLEGDVSFGNTINRFGYLYLSAGFGTFLRNGRSEQGVLASRIEYFSNLLPLGRSRVRNFINLNYTRGISRYEDEYLMVLKENGFSGFRNDSLRGGQRLTTSLESVVFSPVDWYGFRFAIFGFTDFNLLAGTSEYISKGIVLTGIGLGIRIRNENLVLNTLQIRFSYFPSPPMYSRINTAAISGEQLLRPENFDPGPPSLLRYR